MPALDCVVDSVSRQFTLFNSDGVPLRATVSLSLREYKTLEEQLQALNLQSADHTRVHVVRQGENLPQIAYKAYQDPARWRLIANYNNLLNPRRLTPGMVLQLPPTTQ
jgi:nucleoid-associated protein YgaU